MRGFEKCPGSVRNVEQMSPPQEMIEAERAGVLDMRGYAFTWHVRAARNLGNCLVFPQNAIEQGFSTSATSTFGAR